MQSAAMSGWRAATSRKMLRKNAIDGSTLALSTHVTRPALPFARRCRASRKANSHSRSVTLRLMRSVSRTTSGPSRRLILRDANSPSVDSRIRTQSIRAARGSASGVGAPASTRIGRTPA